jgi:NAD(P)-dependent dehydrogenase (short-subunit alcohol dehydrogenase family)
VSVRLTGARCLVTGCSSGIGRATALALAARGARVLATARAAASIAELAADGLDVATLDVTDPHAVERVVLGAGHVDVLVNNAGYGVEGAVEEVGDDDLRAQYDTNVFGVWRMCRAVLPGMRANRAGAIVNVSSFGGEAPFPGIGAYRSSKFAVEGLTWTLHLEVAHFGIRVLSVQPGLTASRFGEALARGSAYDADGPYGEMYRCAAAAYPRMSPTALAPEDVAEATVAALERDDTTWHVRVGEDAERMVARAREGDAAYERYLVHDLGFDWHPVPA